MDAGTVYAEAKREACVRNLSVYRRGATDRDDRPENAKTHMKDAESFRRPALKLGPSATMSKC